MALGTRASLIAWGAAAIAGTIAVIWLRGYLQELVVLAETDRAASLALFRSRVLPALGGIVAIAVAAGAVLMRQGLGLVNAPPRDGGRAGAGGTPAAHPSKTIGWLMACAGFLVAAVPLALLSLVLWMLGQQ